MEPIEIVGYALAAAMGLVILGIGLAFAVLIVRAALCGRRKATP